MGVTTFLIYIVKLYKKDMIHLKKCLKQTWAKQGTAFQTLLSFVNSPSHPLLQLCLRRRKA